MNKHMEDFIKCVRLGTMEGVKESDLVGTRAIASKACERIIHMLSADKDAALVTASKKSAAATARQVAWQATEGPDAAVWPESYKKLEVGNAAKAVAAFESAKQEEAAVCARMEQLKKEIRGKVEFQSALLTALRQFRKDEGFVKNANKLITLLVRPSVPSWAGSGGAASGGAGSGGAASGGGASSGGPPSGGAGRPRSARRR